jgi:predicted Zn-dependent peptidase
MASSSACLFVAGNLSSQEVANEAQSLAKRWPTFEPQDKRNILEAIVERITVGKGEIDITFCYLPSCKDVK